MSELQLGNYEQQTEYKSKVFNPFWHADTMKSIESQASKQTMKINAKSDIIKEQKLPNKFYDTDFELENININNLQLKV